ncbi:MAG: Gfo/Idh/MocA family oxidoreductase [Planctomycetes bacterium]|nr:Gfo/Idh/MocA family oxidoreductase [Planctomycetota bacterium]
MAKSTKDKLGVAIVGCGMISELQSKALQALPDARIAGYFDTVPESARRRAEQFGARAYGSVEEMLRDPEVGAVSICTPSGAHLEPAVAAARAGKHVMVEKPIETTVERADQIIDACRKAGVVLGAIFPRRFQEASRVLKDAVDRGRFGRIVLADVYIKWHRTQEYYALGGWRGTWALDGGGALMNQGIHGIDLLQWVLGGIAEVSAFAATLAHERIEVEDTAVASVRFSNGTLGVIEGTTGSWPGAKIRLEVGGSKGSAVLEDEVILSWQFAEPEPADEEVRAKHGPGTALSGGGAGDPKAIGFEGHRRQLEDFVRAIRTGGRPFCAGEDARAAVAIIAAIYRSAREGRAVRVG